MKRRALGAVEIAQFGGKQVGMGNAAGRMDGGEHSDMKKWLESPQRRRQCRVALQRDLDALLDLPKARDRMNWDDDSSLAMHSALHCLQNCIVEEQPGRLHRLLDRLRVSSECRRRPPSIDGHSSACVSPSGARLSPCVRRSSCGVRSQKRVSFYDAVRYFDADDSSDDEPGPGEDLPVRGGCLECDRRLKWCELGTETDTSLVLSEANTTYGSLADEADAGPQLRGQVDPVDLARALSAFELQPHDGDPPCAVAQRSGMARGTDGP